MEVFPNIISDKGMKLLKKDTVDLRGGNPKISDITQLLIKTINILEHL